MPYDVDEDDDNDNNDYNNDDNDDEVDNSSYSVDFQARTSRFCMKVCLDNSYNMMLMKMTIMMMMMMMIMMMKMIIAVFAFLAITPPKNELFLCKNTTFLLNKFFSMMKLKF